MKFFRPAALLLALCLLLSAVPMPLAATAGDVMPEEELRVLLNGAELHPQKTGYPQYDRLLEELLSPYADEDTYTRIRAAYDWTIQHVNFTWAPYAQGWGNSYDRFLPEHTLSYDEGLQEAIPWDTVNRSYHAMTAHEGVCYDYASLFAVLVRYIGLDAYIHTGWFTYEAGYGTGSGEHGWTEICIDGENYIFDPQRDYRMTMNGTVISTYSYFGVKIEDAWRYTPDEAANAERDAHFLPVAQKRTYRPVIRLEATASGTVSGEGAYDPGQTVTARASGSAEFVGWFTAEGLLLSTEPVYRFPAERSCKLIAVFSGEFFLDIPSGAWYRKDVTEAGERWIVSGIATLDADEPLTYAAAMQLLARAASAAGMEVSVYQPPEDAWFLNSSLWRKTRGISPIRPKNDAVVTREEFVTMLMYFAELGGCLPEPSQLNDAGQISDFAYEAMCRAQTAGLFLGRNGALLPQEPLTRAEGVALLMRLLSWMETE